MLSSQPEQQPLLDANQLSGDIRVPEDQLLRGVTPEQVGNALRNVLILEYPDLQQVKYRYVSTREQVLNLERRWLKRARNEGLIPERARIGFPVPRAQHFYGEIALFEDTILDFQGGVYQRARGAKTLIHESWHGVRADYSTFLANFEEGSAEIFSFQMLEKYLGLNGKEFATSKYRISTQGVQLLQKEFGKQWLFESRDAKNIREWLLDSLIIRGVSIRNATFVVDSSGDVMSDWIGVVQRAIKERQ